MLDEALNLLTSRAPPFTFEIIIVDDGSYDSTVSVSRAYGERFGADAVRVLVLDANRGKGAAVRAGVLDARGEIVLMADADGATVFSEIRRMEEQIAAGADVAIGSRVHLRGDEGRARLRAFVSAVFNWCVVYVAGVVGLKDTQCGFKLYSRQAAIVAFCGQRLDRWAFDVENLWRVQKVGMRIVEVPVQWTEVPGSKLSVVKATVNMVTDMVRMRVCYGAGLWSVDGGIWA